MFVREKDRWLPVKLNWREVNTFLATFPYCPQNIQLKYQIEFERKNK